MTNLEGNLTICEYKRLYKGKGARAMKMFIIVVVIVVW